MQWTFHFYLSRSHMYCMCTVCVLYMYCIMYTCINLDMYIHMHSLTTCFYLWKYTQSDTSWAHSLQSIQRFGNKCPNPSPPPPPPDLEQMYMHYYCARRWAHTLNFTVLLRSIIFNNAIQNHHYNTRTNSWHTGDARPSLADAVATEAAPDCDTPDCGVRKKIIRDIALEQFFFFKEQKFPATK